ncbi:hypothetical protein O3G_MSEX007037 [Manduca sexta]|uniref:Uncharacterized protein n=1 Tax=Manduca sexta TaxID=7130 RepID=A0A922CLE0_MANSE|nr:hypothetical protein O3G_MSEX007037 [Manduca sexta]
MYELKAGALLTNFVIVWNSFMDIVLEYGLFHPGEMNLGPANKTLFRKDNKGSTSKNERRNVGPKRRKDELII